MSLNNFFNDCLSDNDYLGYLPYIESFEYLISKHDSLMTLPIVFGIHGKWGVGKSTFMKLIKNKLDETELFFTIELNPWEYGSEQNFISVFLAKLYEKIKDEISDDEKGIEDPFTKFFKSIFKPLKLSTNLGVFKGEYDFSKLSFENQKSIIEEYISENFSMKRLIHDILNAEIFTNKKIIVLIDDLDRCLPDKVIEVVESIKLVLDSQNCIFFLGCDKDYLESALSVKYQDFIKFLVNEVETVNTDDTRYQQRLKSFSREYLEKIIQIPFTIPPLDENSIGFFVESVLLKKEKAVSRNYLFDIDLYGEFIKELKQDFLTRLIVQAKLNPRKIKRIINLIFLNYIFLKFKNDSSINNTIDVSMLSFLGFIRDVEQEYYMNFLSNKVMCKRVFIDFYNLNKNVHKVVDNLDNSEQFIEDKSFMRNLNVKEYFKIYFEYFNYTESDLNNKLLNIDAYISVSNITTSEDYKVKSLETIRNIKSEITEYKMEYFLDKLRDNEIALDFTIWFFENIYDSSKFMFELKSSINLFLKCETKDIKNVFLLRIEYNEKDFSLYIRFERLFLKSVFLENMEKLYLIESYDKVKNHIVITPALNVKKINEIKRDLETLFSDFCTKEKNINWDEEETLLLLELFFDIKNTEYTENNAQIIKLSNFLRKRAEVKGIKINETFRNTSGIFMKLKNIQSISNKGSSGLNNYSKLDKALWDKYSNDTPKLQLVCKEIKSKYRIPSLE